MPSVSDRYDTTQVEAHRAAGFWTDDTFTDVLARQVAARGSATFVTDGTVSLTYAELHEAALRLAAGLRRRGVGPGDRVAVQLPNWAEFVVVAAALSRIGAVMVPIMTIYRRDEVGHVIADAEVSAVVTPGTFRGFDHLGMVSELAAENPGLHTVVVVRGDSVSGTDLVVSLEDVTVTGDPAALAEEVGPGVGPDDPYVVVYTSGTTARPKGCVHTFNTYCSGARQLVIAFGYTAEDVQFGPSPVTHTTGLVTSVLVPMLVGAGTHLMADWEPTRGLEEIARFGCTMSVTATTFLQMLITAYDPQVHDASSLRAWVCAGSPIPGAVVERAVAALPDMRVLSLYGRSENLCTTTCTVEDPPERSLTSDGSAVPGSSIQVVDGEGAELPVGTEGDIAFLGPSHMLGYLHQPEETAALYTPAGYSRSGDLGRMDADGYVRVTGRTKDIIIRGGMNISVREIEDLLSAHPGVRAAAAVGMPDERLGERVCCYVVPTDPADPPSLASLKQYLLDRDVAVQKAPERLEVLDALPTTATGKIQKHLLRQDIAAKLAASTPVSAR